MVSFLTSINLKYLNSNKEGGPTPVRRAGLGTAVWRWRGVATRPSRGNRADPRGAGRPRARSRTAVGRGVGAGISVS